MPNENVASLAKYRLEQAHGCLKSAIRELNAQDYKSAANRSYYCIFHAMRAVLALDSYDSKKHSGVIAAFRQRHIKTGGIPVEFSDIIRDAFNVRGNSDYEDFFIISKDEVQMQIDNAKAFLKVVEEYIKKLIDPLR